MFHSPRYGGTALTFESAQFHAPKQPVKIVPADVECLSQVFQGGIDIFRSEVHLRGSGRIHHGERCCGPIAGACG